MASLSALKQLLRWARISLAGDDVAQYPVQQTEYLGKTGYALMWFPYGFHANVPADTLTLLLSLQGNSESRVALPGSGPSRPRVAEGEVVVFHPPRSAAARTEELVHPQDFVKRLVGLPGERVRADRDGAVYVNGRPLSERYIEEGRRGTYEFPECLVGLRPTHAGEVELTTELGERFRVQVVPSREVRGRLDAIVPEGHYLMLGDNRDRSDDGHRWGYVPADSAVGRAMAVFWPPRRVGIIR